MSFIAGGKPHIQDSAETIIRDMQRRILALEHSLTATYGIASSGGARALSTTSLSGLAQGIETRASFIVPGQASTIYAVTVTQPCRMRIYATAAKASSDIARPQTVDPGINAACLLELVYINPGTLILSPTAVLVEQDAAPTAIFPGIIRCDSGSTLDITMYGYVVQS